MPKDLSPIQLGKLPWDDGNRAESLAAIYDHVSRNAHAAIQWYQLSRRPKKYMAMLLRWSSVLLISASGLVPLVVAVAPGETEWNPLITSLMVAMAAALFGLDKFFNYSTGWMRYVRTDLALRTAMGSFEFEWQIARSGWSTAQPTAEQAAELLARCAAFADRINAIVAEETNLWIAEFQASLAQLGESVRAAEARVEAAEARRLEAAQTGALNVTVQHEGKVWAGPIKLQVGKSKLEPYSGPTVALTDLPAGPRRVAAEAVMGGTLYRSELAVDVVAGRTSPATLELAAVGAAPEPPAG